MRLDLAEDPSVIFMAEQLKCREEVVVGYLHKVWSWASRQCHDGSVTNVTLLSLGRVTNLAGFPEVMRDAGWIDEAEDSNGRPVLVFPKWENWLGESAKKRLQDAKRQAKRRVSASHGDVTNLSRKQRDKNVTTGEDRRGQNIDAKASISTDFETWWSHYPKKASKDVARRAYEKALRRIGPDNESAAASLLRESFPRFAELRKRDPQYVPNAATWLNGGCWADDIAAIAPNTKTGALVGPGQVYDPNADFGSDF
jgi:hypothetical protein